ncbi:MAG: multidrug efflux SMR transporter [Rickettsiales bacterium]|nr:multidrug efflux SMR transporter [Rickettsiales bacterium]
MSWVYLILAGIFEVAFASFLKLSDGFNKPKWVILFIICSILSFSFLCKALSTIPVGTAYLVWTGIGGIGVVLVGTAYFHEPISFVRMFFIGLILISILGLKIF